MKISINVPTYKRADRLDTFKILPRANYWVHRFEADQYRKKNKGIRIRMLKDETMGNIAKVRNHILKKEMRDHEAVLQVDDDVVYLGYWEKMKKMKLIDEDIIRRFIRKYTRLAKEWGVFLWGINVNEDKQVYREYSPFSTLSYVSASFSCFLKGNKLFYDERFNLKEDYDMTIQQLNRYRKVMRVNKFFYSKKGAEQPGGCATYRNYEKEKQQMELLIKKWGSRIVKMDQNERSHNLKKEKRQIDFNPIVRVPIRGISR